MHHRAPFLLFLPLFGVVVANAQNGPTLLGSGFAAAPSSVALSPGLVMTFWVAVSLSVATRSAHVPIDFALYLPESWTVDPVRREECKIPTDVVFRTKHDLALEMITRAVDDAVPGDVLLGDSGYGDSHNFRETVRILGFDYALGIHATTTMWRLDSQERRRGQAASARDIVRELGPKAFRRVTWREG